MVSTRPPGLCTFRVKTDDREQFQGYLADLSYALFNGSPYHVTSVKVTVGDRFDRIRGALLSAGSAVDMLCDPLTLRFSEQAQELRGFFSPIVFTSGVTYLLRKTSAPRSVAYLGYVEHSTAGKVAKKACQVDLFRIREPGEGPKSGECDLPEPGSQREPGSPCGLDVTVPAYIDRPQPPPRAYVFCPMNDHTNLIRWFCLSTADGQSSHIPDLHKAYFGDREIIQGKLTEYVKQPKPVQRGEH